MYHQPLVSIIINNYNYGRFLKEAIDSAIHQNYSNIEVIVVDDGSADNSREIIRDYAHELKPILKQNGGQASAFNAGFKVSCGEIIIFLDSDDILLPIAVENAVKLFSDEKIAKVHWPLWRVNEYGIKTGQIVPEYPLAQGDLQDAVIQFGPNACGGPPNSPPTSGNAWSRKFLNHVFPIPTAEYKTGADQYLFVLAPVYGELSALSEPGGCYRVHGSNDTLKPLEEYIAAFSRWFEKCCITLRLHLQKIGIDVNTANWKRDHWFHLIDAAIHDITKVIPPAAEFILVDGNQWGTGEIVAGRRRKLFIEREGIYWGAPKDEAAAIQEIKRQQKKVSSIVFAWPAFWWLDYYSKMHEYLKSNYNLIFKNERVIIFDLQKGFTDKLFLNNKN